MKRLATILGAALLGAAVLLIPNSARADFQQAGSLTATSIGVGTYDTYGNPHAYAIGTDHQLYNWDGFGWAQTGLAGTWSQVAVDGDITYLIDSHQNIWSAVGGLGDLTQLPGCALAVAAGGNHLYVIGCNAVGKQGDHGVYYWNGSSFASLSAKASSIAVSPEGVPWITTANGEIMKWSVVGSGIRQLMEFVQVSVPGCGTSIGVGPNGDAWVTGCTVLGSSGYGIYQLTGGAWQKVPGEADVITVAYDGTPWVINNQLNIYGWVYPMPSGGTSMGTGPAVGGGCPGGPGCACSNPGSACNTTGLVCEPSTMTSGAYFCSTCGGFGNECCSNNVCESGLTCTVENDYATATECMSP